MLIELHPKNLVQLVLSISSPPQKPPQELLGEMF